MQMLEKNLQGIRIKPFVQWWKHNYRKNKPEADRSNVPRWTLSFISA